MSLISKIFGDPNQRFLDKLKPEIKRINEFENKISSLSDIQLRNKTVEFSNRLTQGENLKNLLPEAFSVVREAAKRTLGQRHFDVQLLGGIVLHEGKISQMRTGEGKTLVATLPAYLNALEGNGVHVITVNDYLARRDAVWMGQIYNALGMSVGCLNHEASYLYQPEDLEVQSSKFKVQSSNAKNKIKESSLDETRDEQGSFKVVHDFLRPCTRKQAYEADITYGTNNEFGFDYLRDNIAYNINSTSQRGFNYAIIDEIDSILIDEARTPLIISAPAQESSDFYIMFSKIAQKLQQDRDYEIDEKMKAVSLTEEGINRAEQMLGVKDIYTEKGIKYVHHLETAVRAKSLFKLDKDYIVSAKGGFAHVGGEVIIVDEFTGRLMPGRRWSEGLHQAIEAKEGVVIQKESRTLASVTFQNYFRMYKKLSGMTGTAITSAEEFSKVYNLDTVVVPTNLPAQRKDKSDLVFQTENGKFKAITQKIKELHEKGQPVLVGTVSIDKNERLSAMLKTEGVPHKLLNAKQHEQEGEIVAQAGRKGQVTIATNMAGRGVDIMLGGNPPDKKQAEEIKNLGGLFVLGTERHEARRIDDQLRGRAGRQGDSGETQFFVSLDDDLLRIFGSDKIKNLMGKLGIDEDMPVENKMITNAIESAQLKIEGFNFDSRKHLLEYDDVISYQRKIIYDRRKKILFGDGAHIMEVLSQIIDPDKLDKHKQEIGEELFFNAERVLMLQTIDMFWIEHLEIMDYMRSSVRLRVYGQRDPLVEYKNEGLRLFRELEYSINNTIAEMALRVGIINNQTAKAGLIQSNNLSEASLPVRSSAESGTKAGRNDPCPCGSGKKYKKCCGK